MLQPLSKTAVATTRAAARRAPTAKPATSRPFTSSPSSPSRRPPPPASSSTSSSSSTTTAAKTKDEATQKTRRIILTLAFAAVTFTGTIYGAGLKTQQEWKAEKKKVQEATVDDKVAMLERQKLDMLRQKTEIEGKLAEIRARMRERDVEAGGGGGGGGGGGQVASPGKGGQ
ncbi:uncharacterized protein B0H64DRAFT_384274 [Chaetomium fimeti]|uniref:Uncharacterized protein n=1 Tax=Chaetomium fimeti TaxID=1854472 RepID=A0AAE0LUN4_9PEZI|nr:hypothetical protein B0H64DRAFT_384274 [Chaetomium fimeti]